MVSVAYYLSKRANTEMICSIFVNPQNNMISGMPVWFSIILKKTVCGSLFLNEIRQLVQPKRALENRFSVVYL